MRFFNKPYPLNPLPLDKGKGIRFGRGGQARLPESTRLSELRRSGEQGRDARLPESRRDSGQGEQVGRRGIGYLTIS